MTRRTLSFLVFLFSGSCFSQDFYITGKIIDKNQQPIAFANVIITIMEDSNPITGTTTNDDGVFKIRGLKPNEYVLNVSFLGFNPSSINVALQKDVTLNTIVLTEKTQELEGVTIVAQRPSVKRLVDRLVFNVENSTLSNTNVLDVLKHTPGVLVYDGSIIVKNSEPTVYINDRKVHLSSNEVQQLLEGTSASNIKSIEVITSPPAKYEAEGGSVINIVTSKNIIAGYNGSVFGNYKQGKVFPKYSFGTSHFFKTKKVSAYINYNISPRKDYRHNTEFINFIDATGLITTSWDTNYKRTKETSNQNVNANIDYDLDSHNNIGISTSILISPRKNTITNANSLTEVFSANKTLDSLFNTSSKLIDKKTNFAFTLDFLHKFKKEGEKLSLSAHTTNYDFLSDQNVDTDYFLPNRAPIRNNRFRTLSNQKIKIYTGQVDYELPIQDTGQFEAGAKLSTINSESILDFESGQPLVDSQNSDFFLYDEKNYAIFTSYSKDWDSWSLKTGLRVEYTDISGNSLSTSQSNNSDYVKFFPSLHLLHSFNENNDLYFNYYKRIDRPRYAELNPFKYFLNDNSYIQGDPNLKPQIDDNFILGYTLNKKYTFEFYYRHESNPTLQIPFQDNDAKLLKLFNTNIDTSISYGLDFTTYTQVLPSWNLYALSSIFFYENKFFALESDNQLYTNGKWSLYGQIINYFSFLKDKSLTADLSWLYISSYFEGPSEVSIRTGLDINVRKTLWKNRASLSVGVTDIFNSLNFTTTTKYLNQDVFFKSRIENRMFTLGFNYKFGNTTLRSNQKDIDIEERDRLKDDN